MALSEIELIDNPMSAAKYALRELILVRNTLEERIDAIPKYGASHRGLKGAHRAIQRQTRRLVSELMGMGVPKGEIAELVKTTESSVAIELQKAPRRDSIAQ